MTGDAGLPYMLGNFEPTVRYKWGVTIIHINNSGFAGYGKGPWGAGQEPYTADVLSSDLCNLSKSMEGSACMRERVTEPAEIGPAIRRALDANARRAAGLHRGDLFALPGLGCLGRYVSPRGLRGRRPRSTREDHQWTQSIEGMMSHASGARMSRSGTLGAEAHNASRGRWRMAGDDREGHARRGARNAHDVLCWRV